MSQIHLQIDERNQLVAAIAGLYQFRDGGTRGRSRLLGQAGVSGVLSAVNLEGPANDVAWDVVERLERKGPLDDRPHIHALGALLTQVLTLGDLPQQEARFMAGLLVNYHLVDPQQVNALRTRFNIPPADEHRAAPAAPEGTPPGRPSAGGFGILTGRERQQLHQALLSAYPSLAALAQMVSFGMNRNLSEIAGGGSLAEVVYNLIEWAGAQGRLEELVRVAREQNTGNPVLRSFVEQIIPSR
jgi:hypothetical protein